MDCFMYFFTYFYPIRCEQIYPFFSGQLLVNAQAVQPSVANHLPANQVHFEAAPQGWCRIFNSNDLLFVTTSI